MIAQRQRLQLAAACEGIVADGERRGALREGQSGVLALADAETAKERVVADGLDMGGDIDLVDTTHVVVEHERAVADVHKCARQTELLVAQHAAPGERHVADRLHVFGEPDLRQQRVSVEGALADRGELRAAAGVPEGQLVAAVERAVADALADRDRVAVRVRISVGGEISELVRHVDRGELFRALKGAVLDTLDAVAQKHSGEPILSEEGELPHVRHAGLVLCGGGGSAVGAEGLVRPGTRDVSDDQLLAHIDRLTGALAPVQNHIVAPRRGLPRALIVEHVAVAEDLHAVVILFRIEREVAVLGEVAVSGELYQRLIEGRAADLRFVDLVDLIPDV